MTKRRDNFATATKLRKPWISSTFSREISLAVAIKFLMLGVLWWFLFAGKKQQVDDELVANQLLSFEQHVIYHPKQQDSP